MGARKFCDVWRIIRDVWVICHGHKVSATAQRSNRFTRAVVNYKIS